MVTYFLQGKHSKRQDMDTIKIHFLKKKYLFLDGGEGREKEKGRETSVCGCLSHAPYQKPGLQFRHVPWLGIEPKLATLLFSEWHLIHWATPVRAQDPFLNGQNVKVFVATLSLPHVSSLQEVMHQSYTFAAAMSSLPHTYSWHFWEFVIC